MSSNQCIVNTAREAAKKAYTEFVEKHPGFIDRDCCGFASVYIKTPRGRRPRGNFYDYLINEGYASKGWRSGTIDVSIYAFAEGLVMGQSITIREVVAKAIANVFEENGFNAHWSSRMD